MSARADESGDRGPSFAWGAELSGSLDMSSHNMSAIGINAHFGMSWKWARFFGVGAGGDIMVSNSGHTYPIFVNFRTDFSNYNRLVFMDLRGGVALNYMYDHKYNGLYLSPGIGVTLAKGKSFSSHLTLAYTFVGLDKCYNGLQARKCTGVSYATLRLGIAFGDNGRKKNAVPDTRSLAAPDSKMPNAGIENSEYPTFVNTAANHIILPANADREAWQRLARDMRDARTNEAVIDIMHIGDSHIQAEMGTTVVRELLQKRYGNAGRGLITAFKLAGTNQPVDYAITAALPIDSQVRLLKRPWPIVPGFTGIAAESNRSNLITYKNLKPGHKIKTSRIYTSDGERVVKYEYPLDSASFYTLPHERLFGVYTANGEPGVVYSTIGNNGACFSDYLLIDGFADDVAGFAPRLIILSMGTNEGYSSMSDAEIASTTRELIDKLRKANPEAVFMVWTPMECEKKDDAGEFHVNGRVKEASDIIKGVALEEGLAVWDFYEVSGGDGSSSQWVGAELMNPRDHVHLLGKGYRMQGQLAAEAMTEFLESLE